MDWQTAYLRAAGVKPTAEAKARLAQWQRWEGGATNNTARHNYLNSKLRMPGSYDAIGNGVQGYKTLGQGALAFAKTLNARSDYAPLKSWLATGEGDPSHALQVWVAGPGGVGSPSATGYAQKVIGGSSSTVEPRNVTPDDVGSSPTTLFGESIDPQTAVRQTAAEGFAAIAQGRARPEETFGKLLDTLHSTSPQAQGVPAAPAAPVASTKGASKLESQAANLVKKYLGIKYQWGGESPSGFDCSGLVQYVWKTLGVSVPRTTYEQWDSGTPVSDLKPGDAVFFTGGDPQNGKPGHEGMYIGDGLFIEAPRTGLNVRVSKLAERKDFVGARRFA